MKNHFEIRFALSDCFDILNLMPLKLCPVCKRPYLAKEEFCPRCPRLHYEENWLSFGCLLLMIVAPLAVAFIFWFFFFFGLFLR